MKEKKHQNHMDKYNLISSRHSDTDNDTFISIIISKIK